MKYLPGNSAFQGARQLSPGTEVGKLQELHPVSGNAIFCESGTSMRRIYSDTVSTPKSLVRIQRQRQEKNRTAVFSCPVGYRWPIERSFYRSLQGGRSFR